MRIVSLVPHATELLFALGLGSDVVAVTHECDHPTAVLELPHVTRDKLPAGLGPGEIDAAVRERTQAGEAIYELDVERLHELAPDLIVTQALCPVCAVSYDDVEQIAKEMDPVPQVLALDPTTLGETMADIRTVAGATGAQQAAVGLVARQRARVDAVKAAVKGARHRPRVAAIEWFDPVFVAGHWTPQLIELAGGEDVLGFAGEHSEQTTWAAVAAARPEVVVCMPCGYDAPRAHLEATMFSHELRRLGARTVVAVDAAATFSRPGPRLIDGLELLAHVLHPDRVPTAPGSAPAVEL
ncbi:MAG: iron complex transport system substrate-binding protein [Solirubrobacteraceae bacterium]|nr:iron complex transport system substrate-binding protein [Solirubrobacteraceae bacterium]